MRGLVETDHELVEAERRASRKNRSNVDSSFTRSLSNSSRGGVNSSKVKSSPDNNDYNTKSNTVNNSRHYLDLDDNNNMLSSKNLSNSFLMSTRNIDTKSTTKNSSVGVGKLKISKATKGYLNK